MYACMSTFVACWQSENRKVHEACSLALTRPLVFGKLLDRADRPGTLKNVYFFIVFSFFLAAFTDHK
jgi:hypothetical protein